MKENRKFYAQLGKLALPVIVQNLLSTAVGAADTLMLSAVGQTQLSAVSLANQLFFVLNLFFAGLTGCTSVTMAQYLGKKDHAQANRIFGIAACTSEAVCVCFGLTAVFVPKLIMRIMTNDAVLIAEGAAYLQLAGCSYLFMGFSQVYLSALKSMRQSGRSMAIALCTLSVNLLLNAVFIFGLLGFSQMGTRGVALATCIARGIELLICMGDAAWRRTVGWPGKISRGLRRDYLRVAAPMTLQGFAWGGAMAVMSAIMGRMGSDAVAANSAASVVQSIATVASFGLAEAGSILLGRSLGSGQLDLAKKQSGALLRIAVLFGVIGCVGMLLVCEPVIAVLNMSSQAEGYLGVMYRILSDNVVFAAITYTMLCGVFPAGGDTKYGLKIDGIVMWTLVALGSIAAFALELPPLAVFVVLNVDELVKTPFVIRKYYKWDWVNNMTREAKEEAA